MVLKYWIALFILWCLTIAPVQADQLGDRISQFPHWSGKPILTAVNQDDLIYPDWFLGDWEMETTLLDMVAPLAPTLVTPGFESNRQFLNQPIRCDIRFINAPPTRGNSPVPQILPRNSQRIVADRAFNGMSLGKAYLGDRTLRQVQVDPQNPNRQITDLTGDRQLISTVTGRATATANPTQFTTSELFLQEFRGSGQIYFNEVENTTDYRFNSKFKIQNSKFPITATQVTAIYLSPKDPDYFKTLPRNNPLAPPQPVALYRYRLDFLPKP
jgi:hypothetical protein